MYLEPVIQSEVSQKEKNKYHILKHIYGIQKMVLMNLFAGTCAHNGGGESGTNGEAASTYIQYHM